MHAKRTVTAVVAVVVAGLVLAALTLRLVVTAALALHVVLASLQIKAYGLWLRLMNKIL